MALGVAVRLLVMRPKASGMWPVVTVAAIAFSTLWVVYAVCRSPHRNDLATFGSYVAAVVVIAVALIDRTWEAKGRQSDAVTGAQELDRLTELLAGAVKDQWTRAATDRGLLQSEPIPCGGADHPCPLRARSRRLWDRSGSRPCRG